MPLEKDAPSALLAVRTSFTELAESAALDDTRPVALCDRLGLHKSLARKLSHLITAESPLRVWECIPGSSGVSIALDACQKVGASDDAAARVRRSLGELDNIVKRYATSADEFRRMLAQISGHADEDGESIARQDRERAYEGSAATLGISVDTVARFDVVTPPAGDGDADVLNAKGYVNFMRLRKGDEVELARSSVMDMRSQTPMTGVRKPLDPAITQGEPPIWSRLTSDEQALVQRVQLGERVVSDRLGQTPTGVPGRRNIFFAERIFGLAQRYKRGNTNLGTHTHRVRFPARSFCMTLILHRSLAGGAPDVSVHSIIASDPGDASFEWESTRIPCRADVRPLGPGVSWAATPALPHAESAVAELLAATGLPRDEFVGYRAEIDFPPVFSAVRMQYALPEPGGR